MSKIPLLTEGMKPVPGQKYRLVEAFYSDFEIVKDPYTVESRVVEGAGGDVEIIEKRSNPGPMVIKGVFQREGVKNRNGRVYPKGLWERHLAKDSSLMASIKERRCYGQIEHPEGGSASIRNAAILVTELSLDQNEDKDGGRTVWGIAEVLDTPEGRIVRDLIRSNVTVGISSRGVGTVDRNGIVEVENYAPETWDIVGNPSTPGAYVREKPVTENAQVRSFLRNGAAVWAISENGRTREMSLPNKGATKMTNVKDLTARLNALAGTPLSAHNDLGSLDESLQSLSVEFNTAVSADPAVKNIVEAEQARIADLRSEIAEARRPADDDDDEDDDEDDSDDDEDDDSDDDDDDEDDDTDESIDFDGVRNLMTEALQHIEEQDIHLEAEAAINADLTERLAVAESERDSLVEDVANLHRIVARLTESLVEDDADETVAEAINACIEKNPALSASRAVLERCQTVAELNTLVEALAVKPAAKPVTESKPETETRNFGVRTRVRDDLPTGGPTSKVTVSESTKTEDDAPLDESASDGLRTFTTMQQRRFAVKR